MQVQVSENVLLIGTAHVSKTSVREVEEAIRDFQPEVVAVELDEGRHQAITQKRDWEETRITDIIRGNKLYLFLAQIMLASYQRRMGQAEGVEPGAEMVAAIHSAEAIGATVALADRDIGITFKRAFAIMGFRERARIFWELFKALVGLEPQEEETDEDADSDDETKAGDATRPRPHSVDDLLDQDVISTMMEELGVVAPSIKSVVIDERDLYLATRIREASAKGTKRTVAVVGAGHLQGIRRQLEQPQPVSLDLLEHIPQKGVPWGKVLGYGVPALVLGLFAYLGYEGYQSGNYARLIEGFQYWVLVNGILSALGALIARGHILSVLTAFVAAPITSLNPAIAAGWFAGFVEAVVRKPTVRDFQQMAELVTFKDFRKNGVVRVLMVAALANVGSGIATYIAGAKLLDLVF